MVSLNRILPLLAILAIPPFAVADDAAKSKARARAALALASAELTPVAADPPVTQARIAAKAALTKACGPSCPCEVCDCETCECCRSDKAKPMPPATPPATEKVKAEKIAFAELRKAVERLKPGESITAYAGQDAPASAAGRVVVLTDAVPNEEQRIGVWKCWSESGEPKMATMQPAKGGKRISVEEQRIVGSKLVTVALYLDEYPDGSRYWCVSCNKGK